MENATTIARPYATACFEFAKEQHDVTSSLNFMSQFLHYSKEIMQSDVGVDLLQNTVGSQNKIYDFLLHCLPENLITTEVKNFLQVLRDNQRFAYLGAISDFFQQLRQEYDLPTSVTIYSAKEFTPEQVAKVEAKVTARIGKSAKATVEIDPSVVTGFIIKYGDEVIDCSGREYLNKLSLFVNK